MHIMTQEELEETLQFQDYVTTLLHKIGWNLNCFASKKFNIEVGESLSRIEIKQDKRCKDTGNLYLEVKEMGCNGFVDSGIYRKDNSLLIAIGDYDRVWVFVKKQLQGLVEKQTFRIVETETSIGYLVPIDFIEKNNNLVVVEFKNGEVVESE